MVLSSSISVVPIKGILLQLLYGVRLIIKYEYISVSRAKRAMDQCQKKLEPLYHTKPLSLDIGGLGNFRNSVVFAKVRSEQQITQLKEIADIVEDCFLDQEIVSTEKSGSFKPHITVMKLTRDKSFRKKGMINC